MNTKTIKNLNPIIVFYKLVNGIYLKYNEELYKFELNTINEIIGNIDLPYKVEFIGISRANIGRILTYLKRVDSEILIYRGKNVQNNLLVFNAIIYEKQKIKKK